MEYKSIKYNDLAWSDPKGFLNFNNWVLGVRFWVLGMGHFEKLNVWQKSKDLAVIIYKITASGRFCSDFGLRDQIRRAAVSISSNIAEGDESGTNKQAVRFFYIAKG